jgi:hypothetical protein
MRSINKIILNKKDNQLSLAIKIILKAVKIFLLSKGQDVNPIKRSFKDNIKKEYLVIMKSQMISY